MTRVPLPCTVEQLASFSALREAELVVTAEPVATSNPVPVTGQVQYRIVQFRVLRVFKNSGYPFMKSSDVTHTKGDFINVIIPSSWNVSDARLPEYRPQSRYILVLNFGCRYLFTRNRLESYLEPRMADPAAEEETMEAIRAIGRLE
jgi:hypothetical protein